MHSEIHARILIIDDNDLNRKLFRAILESNDIEVLEAENAENGIELIRQQRLDLILMDIQLPGMDGLEATRIIRRDTDLAAIPIIALTGNAMYGDDQIAFDAGCNGYITKPINLSSFMRTVKSFL
jgi:CheY-like chemotaxis protein